MIEDLGFSRFGLGNERVAENVQNILADLLEFILNLLTIVADGPDVLVRPLGFLLLLDRRNDAPRGASSTDHVFVGNRQQITFVYRELATDLG